MTSPQMSPARKLMRGILRSCGRPVNSFPFHRPFREFGMASLRDEADVSVAEEPLRVRAPGPVGLCHVRALLDSVSRGRSGPGGSGRFGVEGLVHEQETRVGGGFRPN